VYASGPEKWTTELNRETADHSLPYNIAVAVVDREVTPQQYSEDHLTDGRIHDVMQKVSVEADEKLTSHRYEHPRHVPAVVTLTSTDGSQYETRVNYPDGHPERPMSAAEIERKMRSLSTQYLTQDQIDRVVDLCADLTELDSVDDLVATLAI
jgi:2-methylcitrate dehydratase